MRKIWKRRVWAGIGVGYVGLGLFLADRQIGAGELGIIAVGVVIILIAMFRGRNADIYN